MTSSGLFSQTWQRSPGAEEDKLFLPAEYYSSWWWINWPVCGNVGLWGKQLLLSPFTPCIVVLSYLQVVCRDPVFYPALIPSSVPINFHQTLLRIKQHVSTVPGLYPTIIKTFQLIIVPASCSKRPVMRRYKSRQHLNFSRALLFLKFFHQFSFIQLTMNALEERLSKSFVL